MSINWAPVQVWPPRDPGRDRAAARDVPKQPRRRLVVVMCMDPRLDPAVLGLRPGDAHVIRNAGGFVSADVLRSIAISQQYLGTRRVLLVAHTDCGALHVDQQDMADQLARDRGQAPPWQVDRARSERAALEHGRRAIETSPFLSWREVRVAVYDVDKQAVTTSVR